MGLLDGKKGLIVGIANEHSIAYGCAQAMRAEGAELAVTYLNEKAERFVRPLADGLGAAIFKPLDVQKPEEMTALFDAIREEWGQLDFVVHSIAFAKLDDLHGRVVDCSADGFALAMTVSVHSFIALARHAEPLMTDGGALVTMSYYGAEKAIEHYSVMGPVKAALEATTRYMAAELGPKGIRVNTISPGPMMTRAASGIDHFDELLDAARKKAPTHQLVSLQDVGDLAAFLVSPRAKSITGEVTYIDGGYNITG